MPVGNMRNPPRSVCSYVPHLRLERNESIYGEAAGLDLCGSMPTQNIMSDTEMVLSWESVIPHEENSSFCFSYQPIAKRFYSVYSPAEPSAPCKGIDTSKLLYCPGFNEWAVSNIIEYYKDDTAHIRLRNKLTMGNTQYTHERSNTVRYFWLLTGTVVNTPVLTIRNCTSERRTNTITRDEVQLKVFSCPSAMHDDISAMERYLLGQPLHCSSDGSAGNATSEYESKAGDLTIQMTALLSDRIDFRGDILYRILTCPSTQCDQSVHIIKTETRINTSTLAARLQQRIMLFPPVHSSGFLMLSNLTVDFVAPTHHLCGWGGIYIYELRPLSLVAKICSPWVAKAWNGSLQRQDGRSRLYFNNRPLLLIVKSYHPTSLILIESIVSLSQCAGFVNLAFQKILSGTYRVITGTGRVGLPHGYITVVHTEGCCQIQHLLMDGNYMYEDYYGSSYQSRLQGRTPIHSIGVIRNKVLTDSAYEALASLRDRNSSWKMHCEPYGIKLTFPKFDLHEGGWVNFAPLIQHDYIAIFQAYCLVIGLGQVTALRYRAEPSEPICLTSTEAEKDLALYPTDKVHVPLLATTCGRFGYREKMFPDGGKLKFMFNKPSIGAFCCSLDLDMHIQTQHLTFVASLFLAEHMLPKAGDWSVPLQAAFKWSCGDNKTCTEWEKVPGPTEIVRPLGRVWTINSLHTECAALHVSKKPLLNVGNNYILNVSFVFTEWYNVLDQEDGSNERETDYCFRLANVCYTIRLVKYASWEDASQLCAIHNSTLLSTPSDYEWEFVKYLFAKKATLMDHVRLTMTSFINLRLQRVSLAM